MTSITRKPLVGVAWSAPRRGVARLRADIAAASVAAIATASLLVPVLELWRGSLSIPFSYTGDATYNLMLIKGIIDHGSWYVNHDLGAPFGQHLQDFAVGGDDLDLTLLRLIGFASRSPAAVMNLFYLLSFPLTAVTAYIVMRSARLGRAVALVCAVLFALSPYALMRGEPHLFLAADYGVPLGAYLVLAVWSGAPLFARRGGAVGWGSFLSGRTLATVLACAVVASAGQVYYAGFTVVLLILALVGRLAAGPARGTLVAGLGVIALVVAFTVANLAPSFLYELRHGGNYVVAVRQPSESLAGGLTLAGLVFPVPDHRLAPFAHLTRWYEASSTAPSQSGAALTSLEQPALGTVAAVGLVWLLIILAARCVGVRGRLKAVARPALPAALAAVSALLVGTIGGISGLIAYLGTPQLRGWNRISIFIAFFALVGLGTLLERLRWWAAGRSTRPIWFSTGLLALVGLGVLDQTTRADVPRYAQIANAYRSDASFVRKVERRLPAGSMVFELPFLAYPEGYPPGAIEDYDPGRPYIHSRAIRWSYGAMKGRPEDWQPFLVEKPLDQVVAGVAAAGFSGIYLDGAGYAGGAAGLERALSHLLGVRAVTGSGGREHFFDLREYAARLRARAGNVELAALRAATLTPPRALPGSGVSPSVAVGIDGHESYWAVSNHAALDLYEPGRPQQVTFFASLVRSTEARSPLVTLTWPGGGQTVVAADGGRIDRRLFLRHGDNLVRISIDARPIWAPWDRRKLFLGIVDPRFQEQAFARLDLHPAPDSRLGQPPTGAFGA